MAQPEHRQAGPRPGSANGAVPVFPRLSSADFLLQFWRAKWLILAVALPIWLAGFFLGQRAVLEYTSTARLIVQASSGEAARGAVPGEIELLRSAAVLEQTLSRFPMSRITPDIAAARNKAVSGLSGERLQQADTRYTALSLMQFAAHMQARSTGASPIIDVGVRHRDPALAAEVLNAWLAAYLNYRTEVFAKTPEGATLSPLKAAEARLLQAEDDIRSFLRANEIGDYDRERDAALGLKNAIIENLSEVRAQSQAVHGQIAKTISQMQDTPAEEDMFVEDRSGQALLDLRLERAKLLSRYTEDSQAVINLDREIAEVEAVLAAEGQAVGVVRRGPNPTYQALAADLNRFEASAAALARQRADWQGQLQAVEKKLSRLADLDPDWQGLQRELQASEAAVRGYVQAEALRLVPGDERLDVRILETARLPVVGHSPRRAIWAFSVFIGLLAGIIVGLLWAVTRPGFATASSLERTLDLPVLASVHRA